MKAEEYIIQAYQNHNIIGFGEGGHGLENFHEFIQNLFDNPKIQENIDIVIVEFANVNHQNILDKYIFGEDIPINDLRKAWRETTSPGQLGELPVYLQLLQKIRDVNKSLPQDRKIRVLAGDPPINWKAINNADEYKNQLGYSRDLFPAELAIHHGIVEKKKVLMIYSEIHLSKAMDISFGKDRPSITSIINKKHPGSIKTIGSIYSEGFLKNQSLVSLPINSIIDLENDRLGDVPASHLFEASFYKNSKEVKIFEDFKMKELFDALLYLGPFELLRRCPMPEADYDCSFFEELNRRRKIVGMPPILKLRF
jgi:hypothetical protein